jgi:hypothetical protein
MYVLMGDVRVRGVYDTEDALKRGVDYWMAQFPNETLSYEEWDVNYIVEPSSWDWCYIAPKAKTVDLMAGDSLYIPSKRFRGVNLVGIKWARVSWDCLDRIKAKYGHCPQKSNPDEYEG